MVTQFWDRWWPKFFHIYSDLFFHVYVYIATPFGNEAFFLHLPCLLSSSSDVDGEADPILLLLFGGYILTHSVGIIHIDSLSWNHTTAQHRVQHCPQHKGVIIKLSLLVSDTQPFLSSWAACFLLYLYFTLSSRSCLHHLWISKIQSMPLIMRLTTVECLIYRVNNGLPLKVL